MSKWGTDPDAIANHIAEVVPLTRARGPREVTADEVAAMLSGDLPEAQAQSTPEEVPEHLLDVPGLVGHITRWISKSALYPQPLLSLGAALTVVGTAAGRKFSGPTKSGTHLYVLGLAGTGAGKNHPAKQAKRLMRSADMEDLIGPGQFMSEPAVYRTLSAQPLMLCFMDEFGSYLQRINSPKGASGYEKAISGALRTFWGASFDTINPPAWADETKKIKPIVSPALSILGLSVHDEFYAALQSADIANGFLNRFLILSTQRKPEEVQPELDEDEVPAPLVHWLQGIGASAYDPNRPAPTPGTAWKASIRVDFASAEPRLAYKAFSKSLEARADDAKLLSRVAEMALRLATIRAIGRWKPGGIALPTVDLDDMTWACELAMWSADRMVSDTVAYMVESEFQGRANEVLRYIKAAPRGTITKTDLSRKIRHKYTTRDILAILEALEETDQIEVTRHRADGAKKPTDFIRFMGGR